MTTYHPVIPMMFQRDLVIRETPGGWRVEDVDGRALCEPLRSLGEARLVGRTFVPAAGQVWVQRGAGWSRLDRD